MAQMKIGRGDAGRRIEVQAGDQVALTLDENPSTGYVWEIESSDSAVARIEGSTFEHPKPQGQPRVGAPGRRIFAIRAVVAGHARLTARHRRSWEPVSAALATDVYDIDVVGP